MRTQRSVWSKLCVNCSIRYKKGKERSRQAKGIVFVVSWNLVAICVDQKGRLAGRSMARTVNHCTEWQRGIYLVSS